MEKLCLGGGARIEPVKFLLPCMAEPAARNEGSASGLGASALFCNGTLAVHTHVAAEDGDTSLVEDVVELNGGVNQGGPKRRKVQAVQY